jgi:hypothetical protein
MPLVPPDMRTILPEKRSGAKARTTVVMLESANHGRTDVLPGASRFFTPGENTGRHKG